MEQAISSVDIGICREESTGREKGIAKGHPEGEDIKNAMLKCKKIFYKHY